MNRYKTMTKIYKVAEHAFSIEAKDNFPLWPMMSESYVPFEVTDIDLSELRFTLIVDDTLNYDGVKELLYSNAGNLKDGFLAVSVYKINNQHLYFELRHPHSIATNACLYINSNTACLKLDGSLYEQWYSFNAAVHLCYILYTASYGTLLMHSSAVIYKERAYLFLGKSGTGKSTHSSMWLKAIEGAILMNDDHPIVRIWSDDRIVAYGSPWSGKTHCYKNISALLGGIIRIVRAQHNRAVRLSPIQSYASVMTSSSSITWIKEMADYRDQSLQCIVSNIPCWNMECLPDENAAKVCAEVVTNNG